jgi:hypothetical protein
VCDRYLLDKTLSYTVDISQVGCACNAALYLVKMPGAWAGLGGWVAGWVAGWLGGGLGGGLGGWLAQWL